MSLGKFVCTIVDFWSCAKFPVKRTILTSCEVAFLKPACPWLPLPVCHLWTSLTRGNLLREPLLRTPSPEGPFGAPSPPCPRAEAQHDGLRWADPLQKVLHFFTVPPRLGAPEIGCRRETSVLWGFGQFDPEMCRS